MTPEEQRQQGRDFLEYWEHWQAGDNLSGGMIAKTLAFLLKRHLGL